MTHADCTVKDIQNEQLKIQNEESIAGKSREDRSSNSASTRQNKKIKGQNSESKVS